MTQQNIPTEKSGKELYVVSFKVHTVHNSAYRRIVADSPEDAVDQAEKLFWRDTQGWGVQ